MNLVLILVIAMMPRPHPKVRQPPALRHKRKPLLLRHQPIAVPIQQTDDLVDRAALVPVVDRRRRLVLEAVGAVQLVEVPLPVVVEVMELEEGARVEVRDVMLFCGKVSRAVRRERGRAGRMERGTAYQLNALSPSLHPHQLLPVSDVRLRVLGLWRRAEELAQAERGGGFSVPLPLSDACEW